MLIKAFKEHERRDGEKEGFAYTPADALAFKFYRDVSCSAHCGCQLRLPHLRQLVWSQRICQANYHKHGLQHLFKGVNLCT